MFSNKRPPPSFTLPQEKCGIFGESKHSNAASSSPMFSSGITPFSGQSQTFGSCISPQQPSNPSAPAPKITQYPQGSNTYGNASQTPLFSHEVNIKSPGLFGSFRQTNSNCGLLAGIPNQPKPDLNPFASKQILENKLQQSFVKGGLFHQKTQGEDPNHKQASPQKIKQGNFTAQTLGLFGNCLPSPQTSNNFGANPKHTQNEQFKNPFFTKNQQANFNSNNQVSNFHQSSSPQPICNSRSIPRFNHSVNQGIKIARLFHPIRGRCSKLSSKQLVLCISAQRQYEGFCKQQIRILQNPSYSRALNSHQSPANNKTSNFDNQSFSNISNKSADLPSFGFNNQQQEVHRFPKEPNQCSFNSHQQPFLNNQSQQYPHQLFPVSTVQPVFTTEFNQEPETCQETQTSHHETIQNTQTQLLATMHNILGLINAPLNTYSSSHQLMSGQGQNCQFQYENKDLPILNFSFQSLHYDYSPYEPYDRKKFPEDRCFEDEGFVIKFNQMEKKTNIPIKLSYMETSEQKLKQHLANLPIIGNFSIFPSLETLKNYSLQQLKNVAHFKIWNKYGSIQFRQPISVIKLNLQKYVSIEQDCIVVNDVNLEAKRFWMTFHNFANYANETPLTKRKVRKMIVSWMESRKLKEIRHDIDNGDLVVEPPVNYL